MARASHIGRQHAELARGHRPDRRALLRRSRPRTPRRRRAACAPDRSRGRSPVCAITASRLHCALLSLASVAISRNRGVLLRPALGCGRRALGGERIAASRARRTPCLARTGPPRNADPRRSRCAPTALTTTSAPTAMPPAVAAEAEPMPPLRLAVVAPKPAPTLPSANRRRRHLRRLVAELAVGRIAPPVLVAAIDSRSNMIAARHDRHPRVADCGSRGPARAVGLHAGSGVEPEGRAARQNDRIDALHRLRRIEQRGLARARPAAAHVHARRDGCVEHHRGRA